MENFRNHHLALGIGRRVRGILPVLLLLAGCASETNDGDTPLGSNPSGGASLSGDGDGFAADAGAMAGAGGAGGAGGAMMTAGTGGSAAAWGPEGGDDFGWSGDPVPESEVHAGSAPDGDTAAAIDTGGGSEVGCGEEPCPDQPAVEPGQLTAAEWNDLDNWDFFLELIDEQHQDQWSDMLDLWGFYPQGRISVNVRNGSQPVVNAEVALLDDEQNVLWEARTDVHGRAELFLDMFRQTGGYASSAQLAVTAARDGRSATLDLPAGGLQPEYDMELNTATDQPLALDLMFMIDTTGSMGDELSYIQAELQDVIERVDQTASGQLDVRLSVNFYRDLGDNYVTRPFPFTTNIDQAIANLGAQSADGGGDFPEAVDQALQNAVQEHDWNADATCRLLFLVLDAPPHNQDAVKQTVRDMAAEAAGEGIQIIPVSASGIDKATEFLLRFLALATNGSYVFLTDDSGIGNAHLQAEPTIGPHQIELLNTLLVRVIGERLGLNGQQ